MLWAQPLLAWWQASTAADHLHTSSHTSSRHKHTCTTQAAVQDASLLRSAAGVHASQATRGGARTHNRHAHAHHGTRMQRRAQRLPRAGDSITPGACVVSAARGRITKHCKRQTGKTKREQTAPSCHTVVITLRGTSPQSNSPEGAAAPAALPLTLAPLRRVHTSERGVTQRRRQGRRTRAGRITPQHQLRAATNSGHIRMPSRGTPAMPQNSWHPHRRHATAARGTMRLHTAGAATPCTSRGRPHLPTRGWIV